MQHQPYGHQPYPPPGPHGPPPGAQGPHGPPPGYGPPQGHAPAYGPPPGYGPPGYGPPGYGHPGATHPVVNDLNSQSSTWLIVAIVGFWLGFGFVSGPLAWIYGGKLRERYRGLGMAPSSSASAAWAIGIATTVLYVFTVVAVILFFTVFMASFGALATL